MGRKGMEYHSGGSSEFRPFQGLLPEDIFWFTYAYVHGHILELLLFVYQKWLATTFCSFVGIDYSWIIGTST